MLKGTKVMTVKNNKIPDNKQDISCNLAAETTKNKP